MLLYSELGRHTPPPPPYSLSRRESARSKVAGEGSQRPTPPPPPPPPPYSSSSAAKPDCTTPSTDNLQRQSVVWDDSYLSRNGNAVLLPPMPPQRSAAQVSNSQQSFEDYPGSLMCNWSCPGLPAQPVEPRWTPVGVLGYPGPPLGGTRVPLPKCCLERLGHSTPPSSAFDADTRIRPDYEKLTSQSANELYLGHNVAPCATQPAIDSLASVAMMDQKSLHTSNRQLSKDMASLTNIVTKDATRSFEAFDTMCSWSWTATQSQQAVERRATMTMPPTAQELGAVEKLLGLKNLLDVRDVNTSERDPGDRIDESMRTVMIPKGQGYASPARPIHGPRHSEDYTASQARNRCSHGVHSSHRRSSASARFSPYKRGQSTTTERMERRLGNAVDRR